MPTVNKSWGEALDFCNALNDHLRSKLPSEYIFSLPTEVQWEIACRAGSTTRYYSGDHESGLHEVAWTFRNAAGRIQPVGLKSPNAWGFYDMHGNVAEWCFDDFGNYPQHDAVDWINAMSAGLAKLVVVRSGGVQESDVHGLRSAARSYGFPDQGGPFIGFRVAIRSTAQRSDKGPMSPRISHISWGRVDIEGMGTGRDFKLFPGGAREWNWNETGTHHVPGIQIADVEELLKHGSKVVVLSKGMQLALKTCSETIQYLKDRNITVYAEETRVAVKMYNSLAERGTPVGALIHSTC